jgi:hypothetical protein
MEVFTMTFKELLELLDIESPSEFEYFEQFSLLFEFEDEIEFSHFSNLFNEIEGHLLSEITDNYFEDIISGIPDDSLLLYSLLQTIRHGLCDLAKEDEGSRERAIYIEELFNFRQWLLFDSKVNCKNRDTAEILELSLFNALMLYRSEKLGLDIYDYDFRNCLDYKTENLMMEGIDEENDEDY